MQDSTCSKMAAATVYASQAKSHAGNSRRLSNSFAIIAICFMALRLTIGPPQGKG